MNWYSWSLLANILPNPAASRCQGGGGLKSKCSDWILFIRVCSCVEMCTRRVKLEGLNSTPVWMGVHVIAISNEESSLIHFSQLASSLAACVWFHYRWFEKLPQSCFTGYGFWWLSLCRWITTVKSLQMFHYRSLSSCGIDLNIHSLFS